MAINSYGWVSPQTSQGGTPYSTQQLMSRDLDPQREAWVKSMGGYDAAMKAAQASAPAQASTMGQLGFNIPANTNQGPAGQSNTMSTQNSYGGSPTNPGLGNSGPFNPQYPYGDPGQSYGGGNFNANSQANQFLKYWNDHYGTNSPLDPFNEGTRNAMEGFGNYFAIPYMNALNAADQAAMNREFGAWDRNEQNRLNNLNYALSRSNAMREDAAFNFGMKTNERDFAESVRQGDRQFGFDQEMGRGRLGLDNRIATNQMTLGLRQADIDQMNAGTGRFSAETAARLGDRQIDLDSRLGDRRIDLEQALGNRGFDVTMRGQDFEREMGMGRLGLDRERDMGRLGLDTELGRGALGFQNRELDTNEAFRRSQLQQEADLTRERYQNELQQSRYAAFGRSQAPNLSMARNWV